MKLKHILLFCLALFVVVPAMPQGKITRPGTTAPSTKPNPTPKLKPTPKPKPTPAASNASKTTADILEEAKQAYNYGNYNKAMTLFKKISNNAEAALLIGSMYEFGEGVAQNDAEAVRWYRKGAEQGNARAQCNLGYMYENGKGVARDYAEALKWYRKSAEQGYAYAQDRLGIMYEFGEGVAQDYSEAVRWYRKSAEQGINHAKKALKRLNAR